MKWPRARLDEIAEIVMGQSPPGETYNDEGNGLPFFQGKADFGDQYPTPRKWCSAPTRVAEIGDILLSVRAPVGPTNVAREKSCIGRGLAAIRVNPACAEQTYLRFFFKYVEPILSLQGQGSTFAAIKRNEVVNLKVPLPPLSEQRRIVEILDQADHLRYLRAEVASKADRILPALFIKMFGDPRMNPMGWPMKPLGEIGELDRGRSRHRPRNDPALLGGSYPLIQTGDIANSGGRITQYTQTYSELGLGQSKMWPAGTLCITIAANIANTGVLEFDACFPDSVVGFVPSPDTTTEYVQFLLTQLRSVLEAGATQVAQKNINLKMLRSLVVPVPPIDLQNRFSMHVRKQYACRATQTLIHEKLDRLFASATSRAFTGDLTASWREAHRKELLQEMEQQQTVLKEEKLSWNPTVEKQQIES